jgi:hypothetical protein
LELLWNNVKRFMTLLMQEMACSKLDLSVLYMYLPSYRNAALLGPAVIIKQTTGDEREGFEGKGLESGEE